MIKPANDSKLEAFGLNWVVCKEGTEEVIAACIDKDLAIMMDMYNNKRLSDQNLITAFALKKGWKLQGNRLTSPFGSVFTYDGTLTDLVRDIVIDTIKPKCQNCNCTIQFNFVIGDYHKFLLQFVFVCLDCDKKLDEPNIRRYRFSMQDEHWKQI